MRAVDRRWFLPSDQQEWADGDFPLSIGHGQTNSQPSTVQAMLELLDVHEGMRILDVGAGSGWTTALLAYLTGPDGTVVGVEIEPDLARWGADNVEQHGPSWATLRLAQEDVLGWPDEAPYDRVLVSAGAKQLPDELVRQLAPHGVMVVVVRSIMLRVEARGGREPEVTRHGPYRFVPLR